ncbi:hypothetical protein [Paraliomyxa miuraensis]|uniref:hypothetical protein n=1 Tax=Paraliomyxa miuraensis TaxID=376150 RepID=UPI0022542769|nr:hypothetical protein [Paraliomyxa miuraensis]
MEVPRTIVMVAAVAACAGCKLLDDDEPPLPMGTGGEESCSDAIAVLNACEPPYQWWFGYEGGSGQLVLVDDR